VGIIYVDKHILHMSDTGERMRVQWGNTSTIHKLQARIGLS